MNRIAEILSAGLLIPVLSAADFRSSLTEKLSEIDGILNRESVTFDLSEADADRAVEALLRSTGTGLEIVDAPEKEVEIPEKKSDFAPKLLRNGRILYVRLDAMNPETFDSRLKKLTELNAAPAGVVLDLRECAGGTKADAARELAPFCDSSGFADAEKELLPKRVLRVPVAILTGGKTSGAAEIAENLLSATKQGISVGEKTAGRPCPFRYLPLKNGKYLKMPSADPGCRDLPPAIEVKAYPMAPYEKLNDGKTERSDKALARAADLLLALDSLNAKE